MTTPDRWIVVQIGTNEPLYKVFATWYGGYLDGDRWKMNSGISKVEDAGEYFLFHGYSGSVYKCDKQAYGTNSYTQGVLDDIIEKASTVMTVQTMPADTDWLTLTQ